MTMTENDIYSFNYILGGGFSIFSGLAILLVFGFVWYQGSSSIWFILLLLTVSVVMLSFGVFCFTVSKNLSKEKEGWGKKFAVILMNICFVIATISMFFLIGDHFKWGLKGILIGVLFLCLMVWYFLYLQRKRNEDLKRNEQR